jgi:hypothetical protein
MSITVLNTDAGLSGKTIVNTEDGQTVTGLKTFDRDPNPPFAVSAASAVVPNLDAEKWNGQTYTYTSYVPTWGNLGTANTLGNGTIVGQYAKLGRVVLFKILLTWGSTTSAGDSIWTFSVPAEAEAVHVLNGGITGKAVDVSVPLAYLLHGAAANVGAVLPTYQSVAAAPGAVSEAAVSGGTLPFTWTTSDTLSLAGWYFTAT